MDLSNVTCFDCWEQGHSAMSCPKKKIKQTGPQKHHEKWGFDDDDDVEYIYHQTSGKEKWNKECWLTTKVLPIFSRVKHLLEISIR